MSWSSTLTRRATPRVGLVSIRSAPTGSIYAALLDVSSVDDLARPTQIENLSIVPSGADLAGAEVELISVGQRERRLQQALEPVRDRFDYILLDCPPAVGLLTVNALDRCGRRARPDPVRVLRARGPEPAPVDDQSGSRQPQSAAQARRGAADDVRCPYDPVCRRREGGSSPPRRERLRLDHPAQRPLGGSAQLWAADRALQPRIARCAGLQRSGGRGSRSSAASQSTRANGASRWR